jgi:uncharacterized coiled-coil protein SlyX
MSGHKPFELLKSHSVVRDYVENLEAEVERLSTRLAMAEAALEKASDLLGIQTAEVKRLRARLDKIGGLLDYWGNSGKPDMCGKLFRAIEKALAEENKAVITPVPNGFPMNESTNKRYWELVEEVERLTHTVSEERVKRWDAEREVERLKMDIRRIQVAHDLAEEEE